MRIQQHLAKMAMHLLYLTILAVIGTVVGWLIPIAWECLLK